METMAEEKAKELEPSSENQYVLTQEELEKLIVKITEKAIEKGIEKGIEAFKQQQEEYKQNKEERARNSAKALLIHYRRLKKMKDTSVYDVDTVTEPTLSEIFDGILGQVRKDEFNLTSTNRNRIVTGMLMNHVDVQLENYKKECEKSDVPDIARRYRVVEMMYLSSKEFRIDDIAEMEFIDKTNVYRTLDKAYADLAVLFFGVEGLKFQPKRRTKGRPKKNCAKTAH